MEHSYIIGCITFTVLKKTTFYGMISTDRKRKSEVVVHFFYIFRKEGK